MTAAALFAFFLLLSCSGEILTETASLDSTLTSPGRDTTTQCSHLAPGIDKMGRGVDITKLDLFHDYALSDDDGFVNSVIQFSCAEGKTWTSPFDTITYQIPDEVDNIIAMSAGVAVSESSLMFDRQEIRKSMSQEVGIDLTFEKGSFSDSQTFKSSHYKMEQSKKIVASNQAFVSTSQVTFAPSSFIGNTSLSKYVRFAIDSLPAVFDANSAAVYMKFFQDYGTHYFHRANLGGSLSTWFELDENLMKQMDNQSVSKQVKASFLTVLQAHGAYEGAIDAIDERFRTQTTHIERYFGGQANLFDTAGYTKWWPTIASNPWLHSGSLKPFTELISDSNPKKPQLLEAYKGYLNKAYGNEILNVIQNFQSVPLFTGLTFFNTTAYNVSETLKEPIPDMARLLKLEQQVVEFTTTPAWFRSSLICLQFDGHPETCLPVGQLAPLAPCFNPPAEHNACDSYGWAHCNAGHLQLKASTPEGAAILTESGVSISLTNRGAQSSEHWWAEYYTATFNVNNDPNSSTPGWLRGAQLCARYDEAPTISSCVSYFYCGPINAALQEVLTRHKLDGDSDRAGAVSFYIIAY